MSAVEKVQDEAERLKKVIDQNVDTEMLKKQFDVSNFDPNAVLRGMQLTLVGGESVSVPIFLSATMICLTLCRSASRLAKPGSLHERSLSASCHRRGYRYRYQAPRSHSCRVLHREH